MRSGGVLVHLSGSCLPIICTVHHGLFDFRNALDDEAGQVFHKDTLIWILLQIQFALLLM